MSADGEFRVPQGWEPVGSSINSDYYRVKPHLVVVRPHPGSLDGAESAQSNVDFQLDYARTQGRVCGFVIMLGQLNSQDAGARRVYATEMDPELCMGCALVINSPIARAIGSFFIGLARPRIRLKLVDTVEAGIEWLESIDTSGGSK